MATFLVDEPLSFSDPLDFYVTGICHQYCSTLFPIALKLHCSCKVLLKHVMGDLL
jgi:hypothetical protein